jgi:hypothetical protein
MKTVALLSTAILALASGSVAAQSVSPAVQGTKSQLAAQMNVDPEDFTLSELSQLSCRLEGAHTEAERQQILRTAQEGGGARTAPMTANVDQLAAELGVAPADFTNEELVLLKSLVESEDCDVAQAERYLASGERLTPVGAEAKRQLALSLGVSPTEYTLDELVRLRFEPEDD